VTGKFAVRGAVRGVEGTEQLSPESGWDTRNKSIDEMKPITTGAHRQSMRLCAVPSVDVRAQSNCGVDGRA
jgi:hypothetical protein